MCYYKNVRGWNDIPGKWFRLWNSDKNMERIGPKRFATSSAIPPLACPSVRLSAYMYVYLLFCLFTANHSPHPTHPERRLSFRTYVCLPGCVNARLSIPSSLSSIASALSWVIHPIFGTNDWTISICLAQMLSR